MQNIYMKVLNYLVGYVILKTSARLRLTTYTKSVHEVTQFLVRYLTEQMKKRNQIQNIYMKELNFLVGYVIFKQVQHVI